MDKFWLITTANAQQVNLSKMDTARIPKPSSQQLNVSKIKFSHGKDNALASKDSPLPTLVQAVLQATTASLDKPLLMVNAHAQLDNQSSHTVPDVKFSNRTHASQLKLW